MMNKRMSMLLSLLMVMVLVFTACASTQAPAEAPEADTEAGEQEPAEEEAAYNKDDYFLTVATGATSGLYYPIGGAFSNVFQNKLGFKSSAQSTGASAENINLILTGDAEMAIAMSDAVAQAYQGFGAFEGKEPAENLRALTGLYPNFVQLVTTKSSGIQSFEDLKGKKVGIGAPNSGVELNARLMYEAHGMTYEDSSVDYLNYGEAIDQMKNGLVDAVFVTSGIPNATVMELGVTDEIVLVPIEGDGLQKLTAKYPFFVPEVIPADVYGTEGDVNTVTVRNIMLVREDLPEDLVYDLTKGIFENIGDIQASHATAQKNITLENAQIGVDIPFHDGAVKYYQEQGLMD
jgi:hypothetical protein